MMHNAAFDSSNALSANPRVPCLPCLDCLHFAGEALGMAGFSPCPIRAALPMQDQLLGIVPERQDKPLFCIAFEPG